MEYDRPSLNPFFLGENVLLLVYCTAVVWLQSTVASIARQSQQTLNCCFPVSPLTGDRPEVSQLQTFVGVAGRPIRVVEEVSSDWEKLALAFQFRHGVINAVRRDEHFQVEAACRTILQRWVDGEGRQPVTWETLIKCPFIASY